jgi:hypothetical protein
MPDLSRSSPRSALKPEKRFKVSFFQTRTARMATVASGFSIGIK